MSITAEQAKADEVIRGLTDPSTWEQLARLDKDLKDAATDLGRVQARYLTDCFYQLQDFRIASAAQVRSAEDEPNRVLSWFFAQMQVLENDIKRALKEFSSSYATGQWMQSICGIGPVISAGMLAQLDIRDCKTVSRWWRFAGLDPTVKWEKKSKRPWNAKLKVLCWKLGESFIKVQNKKNDYYGKIFRTRKDYEIDRNESGGNSETAARILTEKNWDKTTDAFKHYSEGHLPPAQINARARRYAVKMFLSHLHHAMFVDMYGKEPPVPYSFEQLEGDHRHFVALPNWPFESKGGKPLSDLYAE